MKKALQTIGFMIFITVVCISILAFMNESTKEQIQKNLQIDFYKSILYAFQIFPQGFNQTQLALTATTSSIPWKAEEVLEIFNQQVKKIKLPVTAEQKTLLQNSFLWWTDSVEVYARLNENHEIVAWGFPLKGKGLWGTLTAFGVVSADFRKMVGIDFTDQVETPGLGARILEQEFKGYFANLDLSGLAVTANSRPAVIMVKKKDKLNLEQSTNEIQAITGATQTCNGVLAMMNTDLPFYLAVLRNRPGTQIPM